MVQLLIQCHEGDTSSKLCTRADRWRRKIAPTATHHEPSPQESDGWLMFSERGGTVGDLQNLVDQAIATATKPLPFKIVDRLPTETNLILTITQSPPLRVR